MAQTPIILPVARRHSGEPESDAFMIFGVLEENEELLEGSCCNSGDDFPEEEEEEADSCCSVEENRVFWENQEELLEAILRRSSSVESKIRQAVKEALREMDSEGSGCVCRLRVGAEGCRNCTQREIARRLQGGGYNCTVCRSKWRSSPEIPSGEHTYLEVMDKSNSKKGEMRVVIELSFRAEFEMARAGEEYNHLVRRLPQVFVGKGERLRALIKLLCSAAKKCMKDKKMHMAPWRKHKYMQAKWAGTCEEKTLPPPILPMKQLERPQRQRASMLTFDLLETMTNLRCSAIRVV